MKKIDATHPELMSAEPPELAESVVGWKLEPARSEHVSARVPTDDTAGGIARWDSIAVASSSNASP